MITNDDPPDREWFRRNAKRIKDVLGFDIALDYPHAPCPRWARGPGETAVSQAEAAAKQAEEALAAARKAAKQAEAALVAVRKACSAL